MQPVLGQRSIKVLGLLRSDGLPLAAKMAAGQASGPARRLKAEIAVWSQLRGTPAEAACAPLVAAGYDPHVRSGLPLLLRVSVHVCCACAHRCRAGDSGAAPTRLGVQEEVTALITERLRPLEPSEVTERESDIRGALGLLWDQHVAHGDVALCNLVVDNDGAVRLIDFADGRCCDSPRYTPPNMTVTSSVST